MRELGANDVRSASDQDHSTCIGQLKNGSCHALNQSRCGRVKAEQFFEGVLKGRFPVLLDELFQALGKTLILDIPLSQCFDQRGPTNGSYQVTETSQSPFARL